MATKSATVRARIEPKLKEEVETLFHQLGLSTTEAITLFYNQVQLRKGLPFNVVMPNKTTEKTFKETDTGKNLTHCESLGDMFDKLSI
ncbi:type II toxin-antitoxin system RelB/DinJ family antitoxin [Desulfocapsa sp. AH-315-G09]|nr:type II toxin-antitoxin system RelB/DinJ family antitoxin [Desulfocapsa sp.]MBN4059943.1 type II toxin-antitoxin system RelB/DinJ family antitoxin [Desulfotalea psychrophila]MBN4065260.1 type II toxin-antitoxin system RelB/DinJ family antitoxin [Desulfocapsa sp. AH-315-G09]